MLLTSLSGIYTRVALAGCIAAASGCAPRWRTGALVDTREVARALGDSADVGAGPFDPATVPSFDPPKRLRPCCAFGVDLKLAVGELPVPLIELKNVRGPGDLGPHGYDKGDGTRERNGLVYTCRGGFLDIAHVRDAADRTLYLALQIARVLPAGGTFELPEEGTLRRVTVAPLPDGLLARRSRWSTATALAAWAVHQVLIWHEVVTWYGFEDVKGVSERLSAFSPEDLYSNVLGIKLAAGIVLEREVRTREEYEAAMQAWMGEAMRRLGAVSQADARAAMLAVDGLWWDSHQRVPEFKLVLRRSLKADPPIVPWIVADVVDDPALQRVCAGQPPPLRLDLVEKLGEHAIAELVTVRFEFKDWRPDGFPLPSGPGDVVTSAQIPEVLAAIRAQGQAELGPAFDQEGRRGER